MFRSGRGLFLLLDLALLQLLGLVLLGRRLLCLTGKFLVGLGGGLALRLQLVQRRLDDRLGRRQIRRHGEADEEHAEDDDVQPHRQDGRPEVTLRG